MTGDMVGAGERPELIFPHLNHLPKREGMFWLFGSVRNSHCCMSACRANKRKFVTNRMKVLVSLAQNRTDGFMKETVGIPYN